MDSQKGSGPDDLDAPIWEIKNIAAELNTTERRAYYMAERGLVDVTKIGSRYVSTRRRLRRSIGIQEVA